MNLRTRGRRDRRWRLAAVLTGVVIALASCGTPDAPDSPDVSRLPAAEGTTQYPRTLSTPWGETVLEKRPERIVALGPTGAELVVALGSTPVASTNTIERAYWTQQAVSAGMAAVEVYDWGGVEEETQYEDIAASQPDLIVISGDASESYQRLSTIAPVLGAETEADAEPGAWRGVLQTLGAALDLADAANTVTADYDAYVSGVRAENPVLQQRTMTYVVQYPEQYGAGYSSAAGSAVERFFLELGFRPNPLAEEFVENDEVSPELIEKLDADVLIVGGIAGEQETKRLLTDTPLFQELRPVQSGNWAVFYNADETGSAYSFDGTEHPGNINWAMAHGGGPIGKRWATEQLVPILRTAGGEG